MSMPRIVTLSGPSASGKSTVQTELLKREGYGKVVTATTRLPRYGEEEGVAYYFTDKDTFKEWKNNHQLIESVEVSGNLYGTHVKGFTDNAEKGLTSVVVLDPAGVRSIQAFGLSEGYEVMSVYVDVSEKTLMTRLLNRLKHDNWQVDGALNVRVVESYVHRICHVLTKERLWRYQAHYDMVIDGNADLFKSVDEIESACVLFEMGNDNFVEGNSVVSMSRSSDAFESTVRKAVSRYLVLEHEESATACEILDSIP